MARGEVKSLYFADGVAVTAAVPNLAGAVVTNYLDFTHIATPATPGASVLRVYAKSDNSLYAVTPAGVEVPIGSGAGGSGEKNYIENPSAASAITGWTNVGDLDVARSTTASELPREHTTGTGIKITADANTQSVADYVYYDFTLDDVDLNKKLKIQWDQKQFGAYVAGNLAVVITTQADRTTAVATPDITAIPAADGLFSASFDTSSTATLSLVIRATTDMATDTGIVVSDVIVGPGTIVRAAAIGPWESYTPTGSWSTNCTYAGRKRRVGDTAEYQVSITLAGAPTSAQLTVNQPSGETIDSTKIANTSRGRLGTVVVYDNAAGGAARLLGETVYNGTSNVACYVMDDLAASTHYEVVINATTPKTFAASDVIIINYSAPIAEWAGAPNYAGVNDTNWYSDDGSADVLGPQGSLVPNQGYATGSTTRTITLPESQAGDFFSLEISDATGRPFQPASSSYPFLSGNNSSTTNFYGLRARAVSATSWEVEFGNQGLRVSASNASNGAAPWSDSFTAGARFRLRKSQAGVAVGFGIAGSDNNVGLTTKNITDTTSVSASTTMALGASAAKVTLNSTDIAVTLPTSGTYLVMGVVHVDPTSSAGDLTAKLYNSTDAADVAGSHRIYYMTSAETYRPIDLSAVVTVSGSKTIQFFAWRDSGLAGANAISSTAAIAKMTYIRLY